LNFATRFPGDDVPRPDGEPPHQKAGGTAPAAGERGRSAVGGDGRRVSKVIGASALVLGGAVMATVVMTHKPPAKPVREAAAPHQVVSFEAAKSGEVAKAPAAAVAQPLVGLDGKVIAEAPEVPAIAASASGAVGPDGQPVAGSSAARPMTPAEKAAVLLESARRAPLTAFAGDVSLPARFERALSGGGARELASVQEAGQTELEKLRHGSTVRLASATRLGDRNTLILAGTDLPCLLETAMDSATPGYVTCLVPKDVYSDNGAVVLFEKGTRVLGEYGTGLRQGQRRMFVLWTRAVTPNGVAITLASPAADALGRAGIDGALDTQFWTRFGGALMFSIVNDASSVASERASGGEFNNTTNLPSQAGAIALQNSINIPPVLRKAQGAELSIMVAQDLSFSGVYGLRSR
jgi:type IV secretion system protein VirB10